MVIPRILLFYGNINWVVNFFVLQLFKLYFRKLQIKHFYQIRYHCNFHIRHRLLKVTIQGRWLAMTYFRSELETVLGCEPVPVQSTQLKLINITWLIKWYKLLNTNWFTLFGLFLLVRQISCRQRTSTEHVVVNCSSMYTHYTHCISKQSLSS